MKIAGAKVYTEEGDFQKRDVFIEGQYFTDKNACSEETVIEGDGCYAIPGLTDIHFHGCVGYDFCDATKEALEAIAAYQASVGVTTIIPASMTLPKEQLLRICKAAGEFAKMQQSIKEAGSGCQETQQAEREASLAQSTKTGAVLCGINLEGPFVSKEKLGAQNPAYLQLPDQELYEALQKEAGGLVKMVDLAPELQGAMEFIEKNSKEVVISLAHTAADYETAMQAFSSGASHVTHLFNAMNSFGHRTPGVIGAAADAGAYVEMICDGVHIHPAAVRSALKMFGEDKVIFISDSMMAAGLTDGDYSLGGQSVKVVGRKAYLKDGTIAGSVTNLMECMRRAVLEMKIPLETAVRCAAVNPAKHMGLYEKYGSITNGKIANLVLLDQKTLEVKKVILAGQV